MRRRVAVLALIACGSLALIVLAGAGAGRGAAPAKAPTPAGNGPAASTVLQEGQRLFTASCATCHGLSAEGIRGRGPGLRDAGGAAADFYLQTGRMPLPSPRAEPLRTRPAFSQPQIAALVAYVASLGGPPVPSVRPARGSLSKGHDLFALNCAGCHTIQGQGGIVTGAIVPSLNLVTPRQVGEAIRVGPYVMPRFNTAEISDAEIDSIARYVQSTQQPENRGGWGIGRIGPITEGMVAWLIGMALLLLIARLLGERLEDEPRQRGQGTGGTP
jgi:ubiquinol-cytochrome c reductase cytochrome c subunit